TDLSNQGFISTAICETDDGGIAVAGNYSDATGSGGMILRFNQSLGIIDNLKVHRIDNEIITIHDIKILGGSGYLISGYDNNDFSGVFTVLIDGEGMFWPAYFEGSTNKSSCIQAADGNFYLLIHDNNNGTLHLMGTDLEPIWGKEINLESGPNGISNFTFNKESKKITLNCFNTTEGSLVVHTNSNLQSCLTRITGSPANQARLFATKLAINQQAFSTSFRGESVVSGVITSEITRYCLYEGCGEKDPKLCSLLDEIQDI